MRQNRNTGGQHPVSGLAPAVVTTVALLLTLLSLPAAAQEVAGVEVGGETVFQVAGVGDTAAVARAAAIRELIETRLGTDEPLAPLRVVPAGAGAAILVGNDTLARVTARDAELAAARPLPPAELAAATRELAGQWAAALRQTFQGIASDERARVVVDGNPLFEVTGTAELRAARRASAIALRIADVAAATETTPALRVTEQRGGAAILAGDVVINQVSTAEAAEFDSTPRELALARAAAIETVLGRLQGRDRWTYSVRLLGFALLAILLAALLHWALRRAERRLRMYERASAVDNWGVWPLLAGWVVRLFQLLTWAALALFLLWLVPRTRAATFNAIRGAVLGVSGGARWLTGEGLIIALIVVATVVAARILGALVRQIVVTFGMRQGGRTALRVSTLAGTVVGAVQLFVLFLGLLTVLAQIGVALLPLLGTAGVVGIALGFGVQTLIRDFFTGFFILIEDQYGVGDVIRVGEVAGQVERFTLRITQIRSMDGSLTSIPNGEILSVTNLTKDWAQAVLDVHIALGEDVDRATAVIAETAKDLADEWVERVRGEPEVLGVETIDPAARAVTIRVLLKTAPMERFAVSREMRRRILGAFEQAGIEVPPRSVVTLPGTAAAKTPARP